MIPLWQDGNNTTDSLVFTLKAGEVALLVATGFEAKRVKTSASELDGPQFACLRRLIFDCEPGVIVALEPCSYCDFMFEQGSMTKSIACDQGVYVNGNALGLSKCNNTMLLTVPGSYYFHLNDDTAIGQAQIWIEKYNVEDFPSPTFAQYSGECHG